MMAGGRRDVLQQRLEFMDLTRSLGRSIMVDADTEKYEKVESAAMSGYPDVLKLFLLLLAGATGIPVTLLMGQSATGLNATGDNDVRNFYDLVKTEQVAVLQPHLERLVEILAASADGPTGGQAVEANIEFAPLWQPTPKERADERLVVAQADQIYIDKGVVLPEEVAASRFRDEGWSPEMTIDLHAREVALEADRAANALPPPPAPAGGVAPPELPAP
jgi:phage-related protein (TIGR01555 family)